MKAQTIEGKVTECQYAGSRMSPQEFPNGYVAVSLTNGRGKSRQSRTIIFDGPRAPPIQNGNYVQANVEVTRAKVGAVMRDDILVVTHASISTSYGGRTLSEYSRE